MAKVAKKAGQRGSKHKQANTKVKMIPRRQMETVLKVTNVNFTNK